MYVQIKAGALYLSRQSSDSHMRQSLSETADRVSSAILVINKIYQVRRRTRD